MHLAGTDNGVPVIERNALVQSWCGALREERCKGPGGGPSLLHWVLSEGLGKERRRL